MAGDRWDLQHHRGLCLPLQGTFSFEFQPLRAGETFGRLVLHNSDLGYYQYELNLKAMPALPEKPIYFQTVLGSGQSIFAKIINYTRQKTEYYCRVSSPCPAPACPSLASSPTWSITGEHRGCRTVKPRRGGCLTKPGNSQP